MEPVLESVAPKLEGKMAIGKVDCTKHKPLCNEFGVRGFPTLKYAMRGEFFDYSGGRDEASIVAFAERMAAPAVTTIKRLEEATQFSMKDTDEGIAFLASDKSKDNSKLYEIYEQVARKHQASAYFLWLTQIQGPTDDGRETAYVSRIEAGVIEPRNWDMNELTVEALEEWVLDQNVPTIVTLGPGNFQRISRKKRPLVIGIIDMESKDLVKGVKQHMMDFILRAPEEGVQKYYYGVFDGKKWSKFLEQFKVKEEDNPQYIMLDMPNKQYWRNETYTKLVDFLQAVNDGSIPPMAPDKNGVGDSAFGRMAEIFMAYFPYSLLPVTILIFLIVFLVTPSHEDLRPRYKSDDLDEEDDDDNDDDDDTKPAKNESKKDK
jgi:hypothetical protein